VVIFLFEGSFYTTFSFLFGVGFAIQMIRAEQKGRPFILRYLWRTLLLFAIGVSHFIGLWMGDILRVYAQAAVLLLLVRRWRPAALLPVAAALLLFYVYPFPAGPTGHVWLRDDPEHADLSRLEWQTQFAAGQNRWTTVLDDVPVLTARYRASIASALGSEAYQLRNALSLTWVKSYADILCMFVLGLYAGRKRILHEPGRHTPLLWAVSVIGLLFGVAGNALSTFPDFFAARGIDLREAAKGWSFAYSLGNIGLSLFYLSTLTLLVTHRRRVARWLSPLAYVGRMGLTNYLVQSLFFAQLLSIDTWFGGSVTEWWRMGVLEAFFMVQVAYSAWWFRYFRFGPVEWAWRSLTWFERQPMRKSSDAFVPDPVIVAAPSLS
jgi:uncharacterized protein